jgi:prolyl-tRNA editing enzyme YbaK/EbsC (Cys-tRNA(Pro) deacylase)
VVAAWPEPVQRVSSFLRDAGSEARIEEFSVGTPTAAEAAEAAGVGLDQIVKSLVFVCDEKPVVALVPGDRRGDAVKIAQAVGGEKARVAKAAEVEQATGFTPGAVAPFPLPKVETVLMEQTLLRHGLVWAGAGSSSHMVGLAPSELGRLSRARPLDIVTHYDSPGDPGKTGERES